MTCYSTYRDFSEKIPVSWLIQRLIYWRIVRIYYDKKQEVYCREVKNVPGEIRDDKLFVPYKHPIINYVQHIVDGRCDFIKIRPI